MLSVLWRDRGWGRGRRPERRSSRARRSPRATTASLAVARRRSLFFLPACATPLDPPNVCAPAFLSPTTVCTCSLLFSSLLRCPLLAGQSRALTANGINPEHTIRSSRFGVHFTHAIYVYIYIYYVYTRVHVGIYICIHIFMYSYMYSYTSLCIQCYTVATTSDALPLTNVTASHVNRAYNTFTHSHTHRRAQSCTYI